MEEQERKQQEEEMPTPEMLQRLIELWPKLSEEAQRALLHIIELYVWDCE